MARYHHGPDIVHHGRVEKSMLDGGNNDDDDDEDDDEAVAGMASSINLSGRYSKCKVYKNEEELGASWNK